MLMKKSILYILAVSLTVPVLFSSCTQEDILYDVDFNVTLDPENTYYAGDPVTFNFEGEDPATSTKDGDSYVYSFQIVIQSFFGTSTIDVTLTYTPEA